MRRRDARAEALKGLEQVGLSDRMNDKVESLSKGMAQKVQFLATILHHPDLLVLDDLGKGVQDSTGFGARLLDELIRHRNANVRSTFITTNMNPRDQLSAELKKSTLHSLKECVIPVCVDGTDKRSGAPRALAEMITAL